MFPLEPTITPELSVQMKKLLKCEPGELDGELVKIAGDLDPLQLLVMAEKLARWVNQWRFKAAAAFTLYRANEQQGN